MQKKKDALNEQRSNEQRLNEQNEQNEQSKIEGRNAVLEDFAAKKRSTGCLYWMGARMDLYRRSCRKQRKQIP